MLKQPLIIAITAVALLGTAACERRDTTRERDTAVGDPTYDQTVRTGERLSPDMQRRYDEAHERFTRLERQAADTRRDIAARGAEIRTDVDAGLDRAINNAREKLEEARKASSENARRALDDLEAAINDLDKRLREYDRT